MKSHQNQKAILKVNADGKVITCAKGAADKCGWKAGDKVCGKCGAMAIKTKADPMMDDEEDDEDVEDVDITDIEMPEPRKPSAPNQRDIADEVETEEIVIPDEAEGADGPAEAGLEEESEDDEEEMKESLMTKRRRRLEAMGYKDAATDSKAFLCGQERKVLPGNSKPCNGCNGGCFPVGNAPDLLTVEQIALDIHGGKVLDSGYSSDHDKFVVDIRKKDGRVIEAYFDGEGAEEGWHTIPEELLAIDDEIVSGDEAIESALAEISGKALDLGVRMHDGKPVYVVEVDGSDGYSYDVFVNMQGKTLFADQWEYETSSASGEVSVKSDDLEVSLMEFDALYTEEELREKGML